MGKQFTLRNLRKLKTSKETTNGLQKACMDNLLEIWRTRIRTTHGARREKSDLKGYNEALICSAQKQSI